LLGWLCPVILSNFLFKTDKNKLLVVATNLEISIVASLGAKVIREGETTVPARVITDLISNLNLGQIELTVEKESLKINASGFESNLMAMNSLDFPKVPHEIGAGFLNIPTEKFIEALSHILFAVSIDETRPTLTGVLVILREKEVVFVSTDGFRLSQKKISVEIGKEERKMILPKNALSELSRLAQGVEDIRFSYKKSENQVVFEVGDFVMASRVIEGEFPPYEKIIPKDLKIKVILDKEDFLRAVKLASVFAKDSANVVKLSLGEGFLEISAESSMSGSQKTKIDAKVTGVDGNFLIAFNYRFLEDFLNSVKGENVQMEFSEPNAPALFLDPKEEGFLHIIMPVRLQV